MREIVIAFVVGGLIAGAAVFCYMAKESHQTLSVFEGTEHAHARSRAMQAYQHEEPAVAIWELRHLADLEAEELHQGTVYTNEARAALLMTRARLARLYHHEGREPEAQTNANLAILLLNELSPTNSTVTNLTTLLERLQRTDAQANQEPSYK